MVQRDGLTIISLSTTYLEAKTVEQTHYPGDPIIIKEKKTISMLYFFQKIFFGPFSKKEWGYPFEPNR